MKTLASALALLCMRVHDRVPTILGTSGARR